MSPYLFNLLKDTQSVGNLLVVAFIPKMKLERVWRRLEIHVAE